jgi:hypothetical protein
VDLRPQTQQLKNRRFIENKNGGGKTFPAAGRVPKSYFTPTR